MHFFVSVCVYKLIIHITSISSLWNSTLVQGKQYPRFLLRCFSRESFLQENRETRVLKKVLTFHCFVVCGLGDLGHDTQSHHVFVFLVTDSTDPAKNAVLSCQVNFVFFRQTTIFSLSFSIRFQSRLVACYVVF